jgi:hypothetical protein
MNFELNIRCDNAAFDEDPTGELARILANLAAKISDDRMGGCGKPGMTDDGKVRDINGNSVGTWEWDGALED